MQRQISAYLQCEEEKWEDMKTNEETLYNFSSTASDIINIWIEEKKIRGSLAGIHEFQIFISYFI